MTSEEYDRQRRTEFAQAPLQLRTTQFRYPHVEEDAARDTFVRQALQQMLGRSIGLDLVTGFSNDVPSLSGRTHRHRQYARTLAQMNGSSEKDVRKNR